MEERDPEPLDHRCATCTPILDAYPSHNPLIEYAKIDFKIRVVVREGKFVWTNALFLYHILSIIYFSFIFLIAQKNEKKLYV